MTIENRIRSFMEAATPLETMKVMALMSFLDRGSDFIAAQPDSTNGPLIHGAAKILAEREITKDTTEQALAAMAALWILSLKYMLQVSSPEGVKLAIDMAVARNQDAPDDNEPVFSKAMSDFVQ